MGASENASAISIVYLTEVDSASESYAIEFSIQSRNIHRASLLLAKSDRKMLYSILGKSPTYFPPNK
jgi:hypothetical protein